MMIVPFYAALLGLMYVALSIRTLRIRRRLQIAIGDAGNPEMMRAMRVHSNFSEYVPLSLLLLFFAEYTGAHGAFVHVMGLCLLVGRGVHAFGVSQVREDYRLRVFGMSMTFAVLTATSLYLVYAYLIRSLM